MAHRIDVSWPAGAPMSPISTLACYRRQSLLGVLAKKRRFHDWKMLGVYWALQIWTAFLSASNPASYLSQLFYGVGATLAGRFWFCCFFLASNVLYVYVWLADPGYVVVALDQELGLALEPVSEPDSPPDKVADKTSAAMETAVLLKRAAAHTSQNFAIEIAEHQASPPLNLSTDAQYCYLCDHTIPARAHHCRQCDRCIAKFDHHCTFLNNCVGARTHSAFTAFCFCQSTVMAYSVISSMGMIDLFGDDADLLMNCLYLVTGIGCGFLLVTSGFLFIGHLALIAKNKTTWEYIVAMRIRQQKWRGEVARDVPPGNYDQGCIKNFVEDCSGARPEFLFSTRRVRQSAAWDGTYDVEIDTFDAELLLIE